jgi:hypothetical protein
MPANSSARAINTALNNLNAATNITLTKPLTVKNITFNSTQFTYDAESAAAHRAALNISEPSAQASNVAAFLADPTSAKLALAVTDETGTGSLVFANTPTITSPTIAGTVQFTSTTSRPTSAGTPTLAADSLITRTDGDNRFGQMLASVLSADSAGVENNSSQHVDSGLELSLTAGKWVITGTVVQTAASVGSGSRIRFSLSPSASVTGVVFYGNGATASTATSSNIYGTSLSTFFGGSAEATTAYYNWSFIIDVISTITIKVQYAQYAPRPGEITRVKKNSHIMARKLQ